MATVILFTADDFNDMLAVVVVCRVTAEKWKMLGDFHLLNRRVLEKHEKKKTAKKTKKK